MELRELVKNAKNLPKSWKPKEWEQYSSAAQLNLDSSILIICIWEGLFTWKTTNDKERCEAHGPRHVAETTFTAKQNIKHTT